MIDPQLEDKVILITGANHGIGLATARACVAQGARIFITYYREESPYSLGELENARTEEQGGPARYSALQQGTPDDFVAEVQASGGAAYAYEADLAEVANIPLLFDLCEAHIGPVDVLVNNHTYCVLETFDPARVRQDNYTVNLPSAAVIDAHFEINARAYALLMSEYVQRYLARGETWGRIINLSTDAAHAHEENVSYAASKHAIESYTRSAALELGKYGITVNAVAPGPTQTGYITPEDEVTLCAGTPLGRLGEPQDIADVIVFLASQQGRWLTGQLLYVGGGWRIGQ
jgi:3-oxoacyl-[acyl-carrier protein] reductase